MRSAARGEICATRPALNRILPSYHERAHGRSSISEPRIDIRSMNRGVTSGCPACAHLQQLRMIDLADVKRTTSNSGSLILRMAAKAEVGITLNKQLAIDRAVRVMTCRAAFTQR